MLENSISFFRRKIKEAQEGALLHYVNNPTHGDGRAFFLRPGNELLLRDFVRGRYRDIILRSALKALFYQHEVCESFKWVDDFVHYQGAIDNQPHLADYLIQTHDDTAAIMHGVLLSPAHQDFLMLCKEFHDAAISLTANYQDAKDAAKAPVAQPLLTASTHGAADRANAGATHMLMSQEIPDRASKKRRTGDQ